MESIEETDLDPARATTRWHNPTASVQRVILNTSRKRAIVTESGARVEVDEQVAHTIEIPAGETREIPSKYDAAIHTVLGCDHGGPCARRGVCVKPSVPTRVQGYVAGGLAPLLKRERQGYGLLGSLVPRAEPPKSMVIAASDVTTASAPRRVEADKEDPAMARARERAARGGAR
jgi:hypothetical protein